MNEQIPDFIEINGKQRPTRNSEGNLIFKTVEGIQNFWNWFGDSKVVDNEGRPLVMYHGTHTHHNGNPLPEFDTFIREKLDTAESKVGFFFSPSQDFAQHFGNRIMPVYLKLTNPKIFKKGIPSDSELQTEYNLYKKAKNNDEKYYYYRVINDTKKYTDAYDKFVLDMFHHSNIAPYQSAINLNFNDMYYLRLNKTQLNNIANKYTQDLLNENFDGIIIYETQVDARSNNYSPNNQFVVFESNQIKSVKNNGTFNPHSNNIYESYLKTISDNILQEEPQELDEFKVYAGTRTDYDEPSLEFIGSGEGTQTHGWGLYYALNPEIAEGYRSLFTHIYTLKHDEFQSGLWNYWKQDDKYYMSLNRLKNTKNAIELTKDEYDQEYLQANNKKLSYENKSYLGQVHEVDIPEMEYYLDEEKKLSEQSVFIQNKLNNIPELENLFYYDEHPSGFRIYGILSSKLGSDKAASQLLDKYGIKGITYNGREDGRCFVIFNPANVRVLRKKFDELGNINF